MFLRNSLCNGLRWRCNMRLYGNLWLTHMSKNPSNNDEGLALDWAGSEGPVDLEGWDLEAMVLVLVASEKVRRRCHIHPSTDTGKHALVQNRLGH